MITLSVALEFMKFRDVVIIKKNADLSAIRGESDFIMEKEKVYFVSTYDEFWRLAQDDAYNWIHSGYHPDELTDEDILNEYCDWIEENCMTEEEAYDNMNEFQNIFVHSLHELCEEARKFMQEIIDSKED